MVGWIIALAIYVLGAIEVWMVRHGNHDEGIRTEIIGTILWPIFVPIALLAK